MADRYDQNLILEYVEGDLPPAQRVRFEAMLADDPVLRELTHQLATDRAALRDLPDEQPPAQLLEDAMHRLERGMLLGDDPAESAFTTGRTHPRRFYLGRVLAYGSMAAVLVMTGGILVATLTGVDLLETAERYSRADRWMGSDASPQRQLAMRESSTADDARDNSRTAEPDPRDTDPSTLASSESAAPDATGDGDAADTLPSLAARSAGRASLSADRSADVATSSPTAMTARARPSSAGEPLRIQVTADDPNQVQQDLRDWAVRHQAMVVEPGIGMRPGEPMVVQLADASQVPQLIDYLNRADTRQASLMDRQPTQLQALAAAADSDTRFDASESGTAELDGLKIAAPESAATETAAPVVEGEPQPAIAADAEAGDDTEADDPASLFERLIAERNLALREDAAALTARSAAASDRAEPADDAVREMADEASEEAGPTLPDWLDPLRLKVLPPLADATPSSDTPAEAPAPVTAEIHITQVPSDAVDQTP